MYGWVMYYECKICGKAKKHYQNYSKPGYEVVINVSTQTFSVFKNNMLTSGPLRSSDLESKLKEL